MFLDKNYKKGPLNSYFFPTRIYLGFGIEFWLIFFGIMKPNLN